MLALTQLEEWPAVSAAAVVVGPDGVIAQSGTVDHIDRWASVTKLFTTYAVLMACQDGDLLLDQAVGPPGSTVRHLLAHASGLPFEGETPIAPPERMRIYSNRGFDLLGQTVARSTSISLADYLQAQVLDPLGIRAELRGRPSEGLVGSVTGIARFAHELLRPSLLDNSMFNMATSVVFPGLGGMLPGVGRFDPLDWGLGFEIKSGKQPHWTGLLNSPATFGHFGGSGAFLWVDPTAHLALCCLTDREFGEWALEAWPRLADAVLTELGDSASPG